MKIGIVGAGSIVPSFLQSIKDIDGITVKAICSTTRGKERAQELAHAYEIEFVYTDYDKMLENKSIDTIYLAIPNHLHASFAKKALERCFNVIVEKPFVTKLEEAMELKNLAKEKQVFLFEAIPTQYVPEYLKVKQLLNQLGDIKIVQINYSQYSRRYERFLNGEVLPVFDPQKAGGALMDLGVYNVHFVVGLFGYPKEIAYYPNIERDVDTSGILVLSYEGFQCSCIAAKDCKAPLSINIQGNKGYIHSDSSANVFDHFELGSNAGEVEKYALNKKSIQERLYYEMVVFERAIREKDYTFMEERLNHSIQVTKILEIARKQGGLSY